MHSRVQLPALLLDLDPPILQLYINEVLAGGLWRFRRWRLGVLGQGLHLADGLVELGKDAPPVAGLN